MGADMAEKKSKKKRTAEEKPAEAEPEEDVEEEQPKKKAKKEKKNKKAPEPEEEEEEKEEEEKKPKAESAADAPTTGRKLFVGGISWDTDEDGLKDFFKDCGEIEEVFLPTNRETGQKRGFAFVTFTDAAGAAEGVKLHEAELDGRWLKINIAEDKPDKADRKSRGGAEPGEPQLKVFVGGLSWESTEDDVKDFFKDCGEMTDVFFPTDYNTGQTRGFCFVTFAEMEGSAAAVALNEKELGGRWLNIRYSQPKGEGKGKGGKGKGKGKGGWQSW
jgi:RNA recognition motif-containing protein|mmetsp:Transcript_873/g.1488  ORF Transcript_873/g.1488 Transcript_873/m.1488 type:complete len:274 (+) Transcript_873:37-858(+)